MSRSRYQKEYYQRNKGRINERNKLRYKTDEKVREKRREINKKYYETHKEESRKRTERRNKRIVQEIKHAIGEVMLKSEKMVLTVEELAEQIGICRVSAYKLVNDPEFYPAFRLGRKVMISKKRLQEWLDEMTTKEK